VDTKEAYSSVVPQEYPFNFKEIISGEITEWKNSIKNDFEKTLFVKLPDLSLLKEKLARMDPVYTSMSGSGSSIYAIFERKPKVQENDFPAGAFVWQEDL